MNKETYEEFKAAALETRAVKAAQQERKKIGNPDPDLDFRPKPNREARRKFLRSIKRVF